MSMTGAERIAQERGRQIAVEGWTPEHDDEHASDEMAWAAVCYAAPGRVQGLVWRPCCCRSVGECTHVRGIRAWGDPWPWDAKWDKRPQASESPVACCGTCGQFIWSRGALEQHAQSRAARIRALEKAGALVAAEIDRLQRLEAAAT